MKQEKIISELIHELSLCTIDELHQIRSDWVAELQQKKISGRVVDICTTLTDLVIQKKEEKLIGRNTV